MSHTPTPWTKDSFEHFRKGQKLGNIVFYKSFYAMLDADYERAIECVNACEGQSIEDIKLATAHKDACAQWEQLMMELVVEDGPGSVRTAIVDMKTEHGKAGQTIEEFTEMLKKVKQHLVNIHPYFDSPKTITEIDNVLTKHIK